MCTGGEFQGKMRAGEEIVVMVAGIEYATLVRRLCNTLKYNTANGVDVYESSMRHLCDGKVFLRVWLTIPWDLVDNTKPGMV